MREGGQLIAIVPRSFGNGAYFLPLRRFLAANLRLKALYAFDTRRVFGAQGVLQETVILAGQRLAGEAGNRGVGTSPLVRVALLPVNPRGGALGEPLFDALSRTSGCSR